MSKKNNYQKVAQNCSKFSSRMTLLKSGNSNDKPSCLICYHFKDGHCNVELYDKIFSNLT
ncbi:MAG: hypothetical protein ACOWWH_08745 [Eubacteriaceae bacterium]